MSETVLHAANGIYKFLRKNHFPGVESFWSWAVHYVRRRRRDADRLNSIVKTENNRTEMLAVDEARDSLLHTQNNDQRESIKLAETEKITPSGDAAAVAD